jgi:hypothetical protein
MTGGPGQGESMEHRTLTQRGHIRKRVVLAGLATMLAAAAAVPLLAGAADETPSSDIEDYALFAFATLNFKGGTATAPSVIDGNIGSGTRHWVSNTNLSNRVGGIDEYLPWYDLLSSSNVPSSGGTPHVSMCQGSGLGSFVTLTEGHYIATPSAKLSATVACDVKDVYAVSAGPLGGRWAWRTPSEWPDVAFPPLPPMSCSPSNPRTNPFSLAPGRYGDLRLSGSWRTSLGAGTYTFCNISMDQGATLDAPPGTVINVVGNLVIRGGATGRYGACGTTTNVGGEVTFGRNGRIFGTVIAPNDDLNLGHSTLITGRVWAFAMHSDWGVSVAKCPTTVPPTTIAPTTVAPTTVPPLPTTVPPPPTTVPPTTVPPTTVPPTTVPPTTVPPTTVPPTTVAPPTTLPET